VVHWNAGDGRYDTQPHACTCNPLDRSCGLTGRLNIVIPALCEAVGEWGTLTVLTGSIYDVTAIRASMHVAGAFMQKIQNVAFWSVPFMIGRVTRKVPVTINGKRSIKPMSLLYAQVEPDFNQKVLSPMLTAPAQLLLQGMNPETGELPEVVIEQAASWDRDWINEHTAEMFDHENHQANAIDKMIADGELTDGMNDDDAYKAIYQNRAKRQAEKTSQNTPQSNVEGSNSSATDDNGQSELEWVADPKTVAKFLAKAQKDLKLSHGAVIEALQWVDNYRLENVADFHGTKEDAWAACVAKAFDYDIEIIAREIPDMHNPIRVKAGQMIEKFDIPF
jgi:hypothetical protein